MPFIAFIHDHEYIIYIPKKFSKPLICLFIVRSQATLVYLRWKGISINNANANKKSRKKRLLLTSLFSFLL